MSMSFKQKVLCPGHLSGASEHACFNGVTFCTVDIDTLIRFFSQWWRLLETGADNTPLLVIRPVLATWKSWFLQIISSVFIHNPGSQEFWGIKMTGLIPAGSFSNKITSSLRCLKQPEPTILWFWFWFFQRTGIHFFWICNIKKIELVVIKNFKHRPTLLPHKHNIITPKFVGDSMTWGSDCL
jgi:hypothetical protein